MLVLCRHSRHQTRKGESISLSEDLLVSKSVVMCINLFLFLDENCILMQYEIASHTTSDSTTLHQQLPIASFSAIGWDQHRCTILAGVACHSALYVFHPRKRSEVYCHVQNVLTASEKAATQRSVGLPPIFKSTQWNNFSTFARAVHWRSRRAPVYPAFKSWRQPGASSPRLSWQSTTKNIVQHFQ